MANIELSDKISFPDEELRILELWKRLDAFKRSLELTKGMPEVRCAAAVPCNGENNRTTAIVYSLRMMLTYTCG